MKRIVAVLSTLAVLLALTACSQDKTPDPTVNSTENPSEGTTKPTTTEPSTEKPTVGNTDDPIYKYDENGNVIEIIDVQGGTRQVYEYDERSNVLEEIEYINDEEFRRWSYTYNAADQETLKVYYEHRKELSRWTYAYGEDGRMVEQAYFENGQECWREIYLENGGKIQQTHPQEHEDCHEIYNANGDLIELIFYWDGVETYRSVFNYDENGWLVEEIDYENGVEIQRCHHFYDENGVEIKVRYSLPIQPVHSAFETTFNKVRLEYSGGKLVGETHYANGVLVKELSYDERGNLTLEVFYEDGAENFRSTHEYDDQGHLTATTVTDKNAEVSKRIENTYDESGNLIRTITIDDHLELTAYTYDAQGMLLGWICTANGETFYSSEYQYVYENGILLYQDWIVNSDLVSREFYDEDGKLLEEVFYGNGMETGSAHYYYYGNVVEKVQKTSDAGTLSQISVYDNNGMLTSESHYQNNQMTVQRTYNAQGRLSQVLYYKEDGTVSRHLTVYEVVEQDIKAPVKAQLVTRVDFPVLDNDPFSYLFAYEGADLVREIFDGDEWVETVYDGSYSKPLYADWVDCYTDEVCRRESTYDDQGRLIQALYIVDGEPQYRTVYTYDAKGNLSSSTEYWGQQEMERSTYQYNSRGNVIERVVFSGGEEIFRYTYEYDTKGRLTLERTKTSETESLHTCQYDNSGNLTLEVYTVDGAETGRNQYKYDAKGKLVEERYTAGEINLVTTYEYDAKGNLTHIYSGDFPEQVNLYNDAGVLTETIFYGGSNVEETAHYVYKYDENGMLYEIVLSYGDYQSGSVLISYEVVNTTADQAQELKSILDDVLQWM